MTLLKVGQHRYIWTDNGVMLRGKTGKKDVSRPFIIDESGVYSILANSVIYAEKNIQNMMIKNGMSRGVAAYMLKRLRGRAKPDARSFAKNNTKRINDIIQPILGDCHSDEQLERAVKIWVPKKIVAIYVKEMVVPLTRRIARRNP